MRILGIDSSTMTLSMALIENDKIIFETSTNQLKSMSERLQPNLKLLLEEQDIPMESIDLYGVGVGPGSFTGLRIGITAVKMFSRVFDKPVCGISTLRAMAYAHKGNSIIVPMIDARRDRCYTGIYSYTGNKLETIMEDDVLEITELTSKLKVYDKVLFTGNMLENYYDTISNEMGDRAIFSSVGSNFARGSSIASLALEDFNNGIYSNNYSLEPQYLRPSQAERELSEKNART